MKILILRTNGNKVNISSYNMQEIGLAKAFLSLGHECDVAYYGGNRQTSIEIYESNGYKIKVIWLKGFSIALNGIYPELENLVKKYDVVQVSDYDQLTSYYMYTLSPQREKTVLYHGPYLCDYNKKYRIKCKVIDRLPKFLNRRKQTPCFCKSVLAEEFLRIRGFEKIKTVGVGLDLGRLELTSDIERNTEELVKWSGNRKILLYVGRIEKRRNTLFLLKVFYEILMDKKDVCLILIGNGDEEYERECEVYIKEKNLTNAVAWQKSMRQEQLSFLYKQASVFTLPTSYEIFGMVMMEAMYYEIPVVTTCNGGSLTLIENEVNGFIRNLCVEEWVKVIKRILDTSVIDLEIGKKAKNTIIERCSWLEIAKEMLDFYPTIEK